MKKYSSVGIIPFKKTSERMPGKNFRKLGGKPLFEHIVRKALASNLEKIFICTNSKSARERVLEMGAETLDCPDWYFERTTTGDKLLSYPAEKIDADIYVQLFATAPFLRYHTINETIKILQERREYDSVLTVTPEHLWVWYNRKPITYYPGNLPRSQDASPLIIETTGLYGVKKKALKEFRRRVGNNPFFLEIDKIEGWDIDEPLQFKLAELFIENLEDMQKLTGKDYQMEERE